jgi:hypothetical protein
MKSLFRNPRWSLLLLLVLATLGLCACASTADSDNASARPWNSPKGWENGIPSSMTQGR